MMPPTRLMKNAGALVQALRQAAQAGNRYGGSSISSGVGRTVPRQSLSTAATAMALRMPPTYSANITRPCRLNRPATVRSGMKAAISSAYTGRRAEQVMSGAIMMVTSRSRQWVMVRVAMMPGMAQAKLDSSGMNERPDSPTVPMTRSSRKAARGR
jgi:hypothetical protein